MRLVALIVFSLGVQTAFAAKPYNCTVKIEEAEVLEYGKFQLGAPIGWNKKTEVNIDPATKSGRGFIDEENFPVHAEIFLAGNGTRAEITLRTNDDERQVIGYMAGPLEKNTTVISTMRAFKSFEWEGEVISDNTQTYRIDEVVVSCHY